MLNSLNRRSFVSGMALLAGSRAIGLDWLTKAEAAGGVDVDTFLAMSKHLISDYDLDKSMGAAILKTFVDGGLEEKLINLKDNLAVNGKLKTGDQVVAAWYTGLSPDGNTVTDFNSALMWQAMTYTKPWANCGDGYGYWGDAPADQ